MTSDVKSSIDLQCNIKDPPRRGQPPNNGHSFPLAHKEVGLGGAWWGLVGLGRAWQGLGCY